MPDSTPDSAAIETVLRKVQAIIDRDYTEGKLLLEVKRLLGTGAIEVSEYTDNYKLPMILVCASLKQLANQYKPSDKNGLKELKNLENF